MRLKFKSRFKTVKPLLPVITILLFALVYLIVPQVTVLIVFTLIAGTIQYFLALSKSPVDINPTFFFMILLAVKYGWAYSAVFVFLATVIPVMIAGGELGIYAFIFMGSFLTLAFLSTLFSGYSIVLIGIATVLINLFVAFWINISTDNPGGFVYSIIHASITIFYFVAVGEFLVNLI
ncbi:MAG: hypothetical protein HYW24_04725 [Candidatus Aenigmarchaeota archaeon]|nr:hypothetical protein [Candidatus Aenigmarchaeota archaeon]